MKTTEFKTESNHIKKRPNASTSDRINIIQNQIKSITNQFKNKGIKNKPNQTQIESNPAQIKSKNINSNQQQFKPKSNQHQIKPTTIQTKIQINSKP